MRRPVAFTQGELRRRCTSLSTQFFFLRMVSILKVVLEFLRTLRFEGNYVKRFPGRCASLIAFLGRKLGVLWRLWLGKLGTFRTPKPVGPSFPGNGERSCSVSDSSPVFREYIVAASNVPASASQPSLHERIERQLATRAQSPIPNTLSVDQPFVHTFNPTHSLDGRNPTNRSSGNLSTHSRASDRLSIITKNSRSSLRGSVRAGHPSPKAPYHQFGRGPDPSPSSEQLSRQPSPINRLNIPHQHSHHQIVTTDIPSHAQAGDRVSPTVIPRSLAASPSSLSCTHEPLSPPPIPEQRTGSSTSMVLDLRIQNPSTDSLRITPSTNPQILVEEPMAMDLPAYSSPVSFTMEHLETASQFTVSSATSDFLLPEGRFVQLIISDQIPRYTKDIKISREGKMNHIKPLTTTFPYSLELKDLEQTSWEQDCRPWIPATHPDGALYFYDLKRRLFTDTDMHDKALREETENFYLHLQTTLRVEQLTILSKDYDLVLDIMATNDEWISWSYYYACHDTRCLFWLDNYDPSYMVSELDGVESPAHVKHRLEALYWNHWSLFPAVFEGRRLPLHVYDELTGILMHGCIDVMTSKSSTLPYDDDTMQKMMRLVQKARKAEGGVEYYTAGTTRLLSFFAHWRFLYFHGQGHARLLKDQTVYNKPKRERSMLISFLSPVLFFAPEVHLRDMEELWTDEVIIVTAWKDFMTKLLDEWNGLILWSTVMLAASMGLLAIPGVILYNINGGTLGSENQVVILTSSSQIASTLSTEASIGSIVIGLLLVRHNRTKQDAEPSEAVSEQLPYIFRRDVWAVDISL
ncbi:hypothetical protein BJV74DRAFT_887437 [Russula compacta]|nr:hypothetical protein BJV74DRAFT_887437 [Russula compacta]